jgi:hypothetical protein
MSAVQCTDHQHCCKQAGRVMVWMLLAAAAAASTVGSASLHLSRPHESATQLHKRALQQALPQSPPPPPFASFRFSSIEMPRLDRPSAFSPVYTPADLQEALANPLRRTSIGFGTPGAIISPCQPIVIPENAEVTIDCRQGTLDMRCGGSNLQMKPGSLLNYVDCQIIWPEDAYGWGLGAVADGVMRMYGGSYTLACDVRFYFAACMRRQRCLVLPSNSQHHH